MFSWRVTKYNPQFRNSKGHYLKDEWISSSDVGRRKYGGKEFTWEEYIDIENKYINAINLFMECLHVKRLQLYSLEKYNPLGDTSYLSQSMIDGFNDIYNYKILDQKESGDIARLVLRECLWCRLKSRKMYVHFGHDYYMFIGSEQECSEVIKEIESTGLFFEPFQSPFEEEM